MTDDTPKFKDEHRHEKLRELQNVSDETLKKAARIFRALGEPSRLRLITILSEGSACVSELATEDLLSTVSQRLRTLRHENLVSRKREGKHVIYSLADEHVLEIIVNALKHADEI